MIWGYDLTSYLILS